jgi:peptidoglycan/LPS O-acetylase OafA/YrhL
MDSKSRLCVSGAGDAATAGRNAEGARAAPYLEVLTMMRGLAAALVVVSHGLRLDEISYFLDPTRVGAPFFWADLGTFGVALFFVLSGYTLYLSYGGDCTDVGRFLLRRVFRVFPAFLASIIVYVFLDHVIKATIGLRGAPFIETVGKVPTLGILVQYLTLTFNIAGNWGYLNNAYWSLPVEFQFYLLFPVMIMLLRASPGLLVLSAVVLLAAGNLLPAQIETLQLAWQFSGGILVAFLVRRSSERMAPAIAIVLLALAVALVLVARSRYLLPSVPFTRSRFMGDDGIYYGSAAFMLVIGAQALEGSVRAFSGKLKAWLLFQGEISYSLYLMHNAAFLMCAFAIRVCGLVGGQRSMLIYGVGLPVAYAMAVTLHRLIEAPGISLGRKLSDRLLLRRLPA